jgi:hypothetical protein
MPASTGKRLCSVSARWPAEIPPPTSRSHERGEFLSAVNWVKRLAKYLPERPVAPSTASIASAPFRALAAQAAIEGRDEVVRPLRELYRVAMDLSRPEASIPGLPEPMGEGEVDRAVEWLSRQGGAWVHADRWTSRAVAAAQAERSGSAQARRDPHTSVAPVQGRIAPTEDDERVAHRGRVAARQLAEALGREPGSHFAVIMQDLDDMGRFLGGREPARSGALCEVSPVAHRAVSGVLTDLAREQVGVLRDAAEGLFAVSVYAGGDRPAGRRTDPCPGPGRSTDGVDGRALRPPAVGLAAGHPCDW